MDRVARAGALTSHNAEKLKGGTLWDFPTSILSQNIKKMQGGPFEEKKISKKNPNKNVSQCRKKIERGDSLVSPGMVCYAEKQVRPFWFTSLGQMVQFDTIIFCRTFKNYFGQFVWTEKKSHYNSRVSLHEAPTKNVLQRQHTARESRNKPGTTQVGAISEAQK